MTDAIMAPALPRVNGSVNQGLPDRPEKPFQRAPGTEGEHVAAKPWRAQPLGLPNAKLHNVHSVADPSEASGSSLQEYVENLPATARSFRRVQPKYIRACQAKAWTVKLVSKKDPSQVQYVCYACRSWRCQGDCARANAAQLFARLTASIARVPDFWSFFTLTLNPRSFKSREAMYKAAGQKWQLFRHALKYKFGYDHFFIAFEISLRQGALHIHGIVRSKRLFAAVAHAPGEPVVAGKPSRGAAAVWKDWLKPTAVSLGFGFKCDVSAVRDHGAMSGYLVKSSGISGELSQANSKDQLPIDAPKGFRRIRASKGFLVPKLKNEELTGELIQRPAQFFLDKQAWDSGDEILRAQLNYKLTRSAVDRGNKGQEENENAASDKAGRPGNGHTAGETIQASTSTGLPGHDRRSALGVRFPGGQGNHQNGSLQESVFQSVPQCSDFHSKKQGSFDFGVPGKR